MIAYEKLKEFNTKYQEFRTRIINSINTIEDAEDFLYKAKLSIGGKNIDNINDAISHVAKRRAIHSLK